MPFDDPTLRVDLPVKHQAEIAIIDKVIEVIATPQAWCKGTSETHGRHCIIGAIDVVRVELARESGSDQFWPLHLVNSRVQELCQLAGFYHVPAFNDARKTKHKDVMAFLARVRASFQ